MNAEKIFLDANILFSICYGSNSLRRLIVLAQEGSCRLLASHYVVEEARRNLSLQAHIAELDAILHHIHLVAEANPDTPCPIDLPAKDRPVFMAAATAGANYFLTGDTRHFGRYFGQNIMGVKICMARDYLRNCLKIVGSTG